VYIELLDTASQALCWRHWLILIGFEDNGYRRYRERPLFHPIQIKLAGNHWCDLFPPKYSNLHLYVLTPIVKAMIAAMSVLIVKFQNTPDVRAVMQAITTIQSDLKTTGETVQSTAITVQQNTATQQQVATLSQETNQAVKEAAESRRSTTALLQETNDIAKATNDIAKAIQATPPSKASYASVLSGNAVPPSKPITISTETSSFIQAQREIIVKITDPFTIEGLRAKNPRNLQNHVDRAIEQSKNKHIERIRVASANQLQSGDLSVKTSNRNEAEALKQFTNDWINRIGRGMTIRLPTYGILAHGIRTSSMDMEKFDEIKAELLHDNRAFIPNADIKYIGWTPPGPSYSSISQASSLRPSNRFAPKKCCGRTSWIWEHIPNDNINTIYVDSEVA